MKTEIERKPLEYYLGLDYTITLHASPEGGYAVEIEACQVALLREIRLKRLSPI